MSKKITEGPVSSVLYLIALVSAFPINLLAVVSHITGVFTFNILAVSAIALTLPFTVLASVALTIRIVRKQRIANAVINSLSKSSDTEIT